MDEEQFVISLAKYSIVMVKYHGYSQWEKILYRRQCFPDNYSGGDQQFLRELKKNGAEVNTAKYSYTAAVYGVSRLLCHLNVITLLYVVFENVYINSFSAYALSISLVVFSAILYFVYTTVLSENSVNIADDAYTLAILLTFGFAFTPVIRTLTDTISSDTVYALSFFFAMISCIFHDYGIKAPIVSFSLSVSSGLSSEVFLLSRLGSNIQAFAMLSASFAVHAYSPIFRNRMFAFHPEVSAFLTLCLSLCSIYFLHILYFELAIVWLLIQMQKDVENVWDKSRGNEEKHLLEPRFNIYDIRQESSFGSVASSDAGGDISEFSGSDADSLLGILDSDNDSEADFEKSVFLIVYLNFYRIYSLMFCFSCDFTADLTVSDEDVMFSDDEKEKEFRESKAARRRDKMGGAVTFRISPDSADSELRCSVKGCVIGMISPGCRTSTGLLSIEDYPRSRRCRPVNTPRTREIVKNKIILDDER
uniref:Phosphatidylinositol N-acetylglucosaminyltransferase subunit C n=1 Tax=Heterorhabditis bacteriophora TaxID=37862 RepID=A0A1I7XKR1_HETBA